MELKEYSPCYQWVGSPIVSQDRVYGLRYPPPALEKGTIDAAEWCCLKPDSIFGFQKVLKHYYLQGLHQVVVNADLYINGDVYNSLTDHQKRRSRYRRTLRS